MAILLSTVPICLPGGVRVGQVTFEQFMNLLCFFFFYPPPSIPLPPSAVSPLACSYLVGFCWRDFSIFCSFTDTTMQLFLLTYMWYSSWAAMLKRWLTPLLVIIVDQFDRSIYLIPFHRCHFFQFNSSDTKKKQKKTLFYLMYTFFFF